MSVLACDRSGCDNIMCNRYNERYGYICEDCFQEARDKGLTSKDMAVFMNSAKEDPDQDLDDYFPARDTDW
jgi:hypothetical protein